MNKMIPMFFFILFFGIMFSEEESELERYRRMQRDEIQQWRQERDAELDAYRERVERDRKEWQEYVNSVRTVWGEYTNTTPTLWADYGKDLRTLSVVDFENNKVEVAAVIETDDPEEAQRLLKEKFTELLNEKEEGTGNNFMEGQIAFEKAREDNERKIRELQEQHAIRQAELFKRVQEENRQLEAQKLELERKAEMEQRAKEREKILEEKRRTEQKQAEIARKERDERRSLEEQRRKEEEKLVRTVDKSNSSQFIEKAVKENVQKEIIIGEDGRARTKFSITLEMAPNAIQRRAEQYMDLIVEYSKKYDLDVSVVLALIQTESAFNPRAFSRRPDGTPMAIGLMQIIPSQAGRDAHKALYGTDKIVETEYLFDPVNNMKMGTWYLRFLYRWWERYENRSFGRTSSSVKNEYLAIASYNQGMGTILNNAYRIHNLIDKSDEETFRILTTEPKIPLEGRNYLKKIEERKHIYRKN